jgi:hypothetical protein
MDILVRYDKGDLTESEQQEIIKISQDYGDVRMEPLGIRSGAIDLVSCIEFSLGAQIFKIVSDAFLKGLINDDYIKGLGKQVRLFFEGQTMDIRSLISAYYKVFIANNRTNNKAISFVEHFQKYTIYAVLNANKTTPKITEGLAEALVRTCSLISQRIFDENNESYIIQLYPNFSTETWDYVFAPTMDAFGRYIDRYFDFNDNEFHYLNSTEEFISKFGIENIDEYKFIIYPKIRR